jgi:hypothetical protein
VKIGQDLAAMTILKRIVDWLRQVNFVDDQLSHGKVTLSAILMENCIATCCPR